MKKVFLFVFIATFQMEAIHAQQDSTTQTVTIHSKLLGGNWDLKISLPDNYQEGEKYPVIYITDGASSNYRAAKNYLETLSDPAYRLIPPSILVGLVQQERNRELGLEDLKRGEQFTQYLHQEVIPYINSNYSSSGFNAMIGHSNGAEFNHSLLMAKNNPFRGFISISTNFNRDVKGALASFLTHYTGKEMYYFIANGTYDAPSRTRAGNDFEALATAANNPSIKFGKQNYDGDHNSIVPLALTDALLFLFQKYNIVDSYTSIKDYAENYLKDLKENYGVKGSYYYYDLDAIHMDIIMNKKIEDYQYFLTFVAQHKLWHGGGLDPANIANQYWIMGRMPETITYYNQALNEFDKVEPMVFYGNINRAIDAYKKQGQVKEGIAFMVKGREKLGEEYLLVMNYKIAQLSLANKVAVRKGKKALAYCKTNYRKNGLFKWEDLIALEKK